MACEFGCSECGGSGVVDSGGFREDGKPIDVPCGMCGPQSDTTTNDGVFFVEPDHPVCSKCISSLDRDERCFECGGDGWVDRSEYDDDDEDRGITTCPECFGEPSGWFCPTCKRHWSYHQVAQPTNTPRADGNSTFNGGVSMTSMPEGTVPPRTNTATHQPNISYVQEVTPQVRQSSDALLARDLWCLLWGYRAAANVLSDADGDGPIRQKLHTFASDIEDILKRHGF